MGLSTARSQITTPGAEGKLKCVYEERMEPYTAMLINMSRTWASFIKLDMREFTHRITDTSNEVFMKVREKRSQPTYQSS